MIYDLGNARLFKNSDGAYQRNKYDNCADVMDMEIAMFCSRNKHESNELSRSDDLESLGYSIIYLCTGRLPWSDDVRHFLPPIMPNLEVTRLQLIISLARKWDIWIILMTCAQTYTSESNFT